MTHSGRFELAPLAQRLDFGRSGVQTPTAALDQRS
jgi:hypothetical protein